MVLFLMNHEAARKLMLEKGKEIGLTPVESKTRNSNRAIQADDH